MPPYPTRSYVRAHPSFQLNDGSEVATQSPTKRSPSKRSPSKQSPYKRPPTKGSQRGAAPSKRPQLEVKVMTFPVLREGSVQPTPRVTDPTTPQTCNPPTSEDLSRAPRKLKRASRVVGGGIDGSQSWLAARQGVREDVSPLTSLAPGRLPSLQEMEAEDEGTMQKEYARLMKNREAARRAQEQQGKENRTATGASPDDSMDVDQGGPSAAGSDYPATVRCVKRTDTEEVFN